MQQASKEFVSKLNTVPLLLRITFSDGRTIPEDPTKDYLDPVQSVELIGGSSNGSTVSIGCAIAAGAEITLERSLLGSSELSGQFFLELGMKLKEGYEWIPGGKYRIQKEQKADDTITLQCADDIGTLLECPYEPLQGFNFEEGVDGKQFVLALCTRRGVPVDLTGLPDVVLKIAEPLDLTERQIIAAMAGLWGKFACMDRTGTLRFLWYGQTDETITPDKYYDGECVCGEQFIAAYLKCYNSTLAETLTAGDGTQKQGLYFECPWCSQEQLEALWSSLQAFSYTAVESVRLLGNPLLDPWDMITLNDGNDGVHTVPVMSISHEYDGGLITEISAPGEANAEMQEGPVQREIKKTTAKILKRQNAIELFVSELSENYAQLVIDVDSISMEVVKQKIVVSDLDEKFTQDVESLQSQIDGSITTWFYNYEPTSSNEPASLWSTTEKKNQHLGDLFYIIDSDEKTGQVYRWALVSSVYKWVIVEDADVTKALADAAKAQDTADAKRRTFISQPAPPYDVGDLWLNGTDILVCVTSRLAGSYIATDWQKKTTYTTEATVAAQIQTSANSILQTVKGTYATIDSLGQYAKTTEVAASIKSAVDEKGASILQEVSVTYATTESVNASLELKVGKNENDQIVSMLNASANEINLKGNRVSIQSDYFTLAKDGTATLTAGKIGGVTVSSGNLYSGGKSGVGNTEAGYFLGQTGEFSFGSGNQYMRMVKQSDGSYKMEIALDDFTINGSGTLTQVLTVFGNNITNQNTLIEDMQYSGHNLLRNSDSLNLWALEPEASISKRADGYWVINTRTPTYRYGIYQDVAVEPNTDYVLSYDAINNSSGVSIGIPSPSLGDNTTMNTANGRLTQTFNSGSATTVRIYFFTKMGSSCYVRFPKLEKGTTATLWNSGVDHQQVFNALTAGGEIQGIFIQDGKFYFNAQAGKVINLHANDIVAGRLSSLDGKTYLDLDASYLRTEDDSGRYIEMKKGRFQFYDDYGNEAITIGVSSLGYPAFHVTGRSGYYAGLAAYDHPQFFAPDESRDYDMSGYIPVWKYINGIRYLVGVDSGVLPEAVSTATV